MEDWMKQKKSLLLIIVILFFFTSVVFSKTTVKIGPFGGINFSSRSGWTSGDHYKGISVPITGINLDIAFGKHISLSLQPQYIQKGYQHVEGQYVLKGYVIYLYGGQTIEYYLPTDYQHTYGYIEIPVLFKYTVFKNGISPYILAGPSLGLWISTRTENRYGPAGQDKEYFNSGSGDRKWDFDLIGGVGIQIPIGRMYIISECKYSMEIFDKEFEFSRENRGIWVSVGLIFSLNKKGLE